MNDFSVVRRANQNIKENTVEEQKRLKYRFTSNVNDTSTGIISGASSSTGGNSNPNMDMGSISSNNGIQEPKPVFDSFAVITIVLTIIVVVGSFYFYKRSKRELKKTLELLESQRTDCILNLSLVRKKYSLLSAYKNASNKSMFELVNIDLVYTSAF